MTLLNNTLVLDIGLVKYILKVDLEYSPEKISEAMMVDKKGMCALKEAREKSQLESKF